MKHMAEMKLNDVTPTSFYVHDVSPEDSEEMSSTLRLSYLLTLPFFNTVALITNALIFFIFSTAKMRKYRASVFFRYLAVVDAGQSCVTFGLMWLTLLAPPSTRTAEENHRHCRMYTVLRNTLQDLSAYGVVCLLMERCSAMSARSSCRPVCLLLTVCRFQWVVRHLSCKLFLFTMTVLVLILNMGIVLSARHELEQIAFTDCFNTWKTDSDFAYDFRSLAMNHVLLSMVIPTLCLVVCYLCLRVLLSRQQTWAFPGVFTPAGLHIPSSDRPLQQRRAHSTQQPTAPGEAAGAPGNPTRATACSAVTQAHWIHLGPHPVTTTTNSWMPPPVPRLPPPVPGGPTLTMMCVDDISDEEEEGGARDSRFLDRLYAMIKRRELVLSMVFVEDSRLASLPPASLTHDLNAMASMAAVLFILLVQPQLLLMMCGCIMRSVRTSGIGGGRHQHDHSDPGARTADGGGDDGSDASGSDGLAMDWSLLQNVGLAADLVFNNRVSFTLFLYLFVGGRRMAVLLVQLLRRFLASCLCCCSAGGCCFLLAPAWRSLRRHARPRPGPRSRFCPRSFSAPGSGGGFTGFPGGALLLSGPVPAMSTVLAGPPPQGGFGAGGGAAPPVVVPKVSIMTPS